MPRAGFGLIADMASSRQDPFPMTTLLLRPKLGFLEAVVLGACSWLLLCGTAQANIIEFDALLSGPAESPPNNSPGTGEAEVFYDNANHTLEVKVTFADLVANTIASHIHAATAAPLTGTAGVATQLPTFLNFPLGVTSGTYDHTLDLTQLSSYNPAFVSAHGGTASSAEAALVGALFSDEAYLNIHTTAHPGGEIRGFLTQVPDQSETALLLAGALGAMIVLARFQPLAAGRYSR